MVAEEEELEEEEEVEEEEEEELLGDVSRLLGTLQMMQHSVEVFGFGWLISPHFRHCHGCLDRW